MKKILYCLLLSFCFAGASVADDQGPIAFRDTVTDYEYTVYGSRNGTSYINTWESDDTYEVITETMNGWPYYQTFLDHRWSIDVTGGDTVTLFLESHCDRVEDYFYISYNTDLNASKTRLFTVSQTGDTVLSAALPSHISGTVYIYVNDTDKSWWHQYKDSIYIDHMYIESVCESTLSGNPEPADGAVDVGRTIDLSWDSACTPAEHDVYFGTSYDDVAGADPNSPEFRGSQIENVYTPEALTPNTTYYWRIDEVIDNETYTGDVFSFTAYPTAHTPDPVDGSTHVYNQGRLAWEAGTDGANAFHVYLGSGYTDVSEATVNSQGIFKATTTETTYEPGIFEFNTCHYWRIDEIDASGTVHPGPVWSFFVPGLKEPVPGEVDPAIGGGEGYGHIISLSDCTEPGCVLVDYAELTLPYDEVFEGITEPKLMRVYDKGTLLDALLNRAAYGDIVFIPDVDHDGRAIAIDLTGENAIPIPGGVTLCGERGKAANNLEVLKGALIFTNEFQTDGQKNTQCLFSLEEPGIRFTGLRIRGPEHTEASANKNTRRGINITGAAGDAEIDNCNLSNWGLWTIGVHCGENHSPEIHHNYIHDTRNPLNTHEADPETYGYGIEVNIGFPIIYANVFQRCGHAVAGRGVIGCSYEAAYNIILNGLENLAIGNSDNVHNFDMHGMFYTNGIKVDFCQNVCIDWLNCTGCRAGDLTRIHHNTFAWPPSPSTGYGFAIQIRGRPGIASEIYDNWFFHQTINDAVRQSHTNGNTYVGDDVNASIPDNLVGFEWLEACDYEPNVQGVWSDHWPNTPPN